MGWQYIFIVLAYCQLYQALRRQRYRIQPRQIQICYRHRRIRPFRYLLRWISTHTETVWIFWTSYHRPTPQMFVVWTHQPSRLYIRPGIGQGTIPRFTEAWRAVPLGRYVGETFSRVQEKNIRHDYRGRQNLWTGKTNLHNNRLERHRFYTYPKTLPLSNKKRCAGPDTWNSSMLVQDLPNRLKVAMHPLRAKRWHCYSVSIAVACILWDVPIY